MLSLTLKSRLAPPTFLLTLPGAFPTVVVLSSEQLEEGGLSVRDSREDDDEETDPGSAACVAVKELCVTFPLDSAVPLILVVVPFMILRWLLLPLLKPAVTLLLQMLFLLPDATTAVATFFKTSNAA